METGWNDPKVIEEMAKKAFGDAAKETMEVMGYNVIAEDGYVVKVFKDGTKERIEKIEN